MVERQRSNLVNRVVIRSLAALDATKGRIRACETKLLNDWPTPSVGHTGLDQR